MRTGLDGRRILVLEDDPLIALEIETTLADAGARVLGPAHSEAEAMALIDAAISDAAAPDADGAPTIDGAVLDVYLGGTTCEKVAAHLTSRGVPFVFHSGFARDADPFVARSTAPHLRKPASAEALVAALDDDL